MCLLICKPAGIVINRDALLIASETNGDGAGLAWHHDGRVEIGKGLWDFKTLDEELTRVEAMPCMIHLRMATHGGISLENTHPFALRNGWAFAHNGIIKIEHEKDESDTRAYVRKVMDPLLGHEKAWHVNEPMLKHPKVKESIEDSLTGSRAAILMADGQFVIYIEKQGHWSGGAWFSNESYKEGYFMRNYHATWDDDYFREVKEVKDVREPDYDCDLIELNTKRLFCDVFGQGIYGDFYVDKHYGITYCETCSSQQWLDETMASHNYRK